MATMPESLNVVKLCGLLILCWTHVSGAAQFRFQPRNGMSWNGTMTSPTQTLLPVSTIDSQSIPTTPAQLPEYFVSPSTTPSHSPLGNHSTIASSAMPSSISQSTPDLTSRLTPSPPSNTSEIAPSNSTLPSQPTTPFPSTTAQAAFNNASCSGTFVNIATAMLEWWYPRVYDYAACVLFIPPNNTDQWSSRSATTTFDVASALAGPQIIQSVYINTLVNSTYTDTSYVNTPLPTFAATRVATQTAFRSMNVTKGPLPYPNAVITPPPATITIQYSPSSTKAVTYGTPVVFWRGYQIDHYKPSTYQNGSQFCHTSRSLHDLSAPYIIHYNGSNPDGLPEVTGKIPAHFMSAIGSPNATAGKWTAKPTLIVVEQEVCAVESSHPVFIIGSMSVTEFSSVEASSFFVSYATLSNGKLSSTTVAVAPAPSIPGLMTSETALKGPVIAGTAVTETTETSFMVPTQTATVVQITTRGNMQIPLGITTSATPTVLPAVVSGDGNTGSSQSPDSNAGSNTSAQSGSDDGSDQGSGSQSGGSGSSQSGSDGNTAPANEAGSSGASSTNQDTGPDLGSIIAGVIGAAQSEPKPTPVVESADSGGTNQGAAAEVSDSGAGQSVSSGGSPSSQSGSTSQSGQSAGNGGSLGPAQEQSQGQSSGSSNSGNLDGPGPSGSVGDSEDQGQTSGSSASSNSDGSGSAVPGQSSQADQSGNGASGSSPAQVPQGQQSGGSGGSPQLVSATSPVVRVGSVQLTQQAVPVLQVGTSTLFPGAGSGSGSGSFTANGMTIAAATNGVIVNGQTSTIAGSSTPQMITAGGQGVLVQPTPAFMIGGEAVVAGAPARTIDGTVYSLAPSGTALIISTSTMVISQPPTSPTAASKLLSIGSNTYTANAFSEFVVGSQTLVPGGPAMTLTGNTVVSLPSPGTVAIIGTRTQVLGSAITPAPLLTLAGTIYKPNSGATFYVDNQVLVPGSTIVEHGTTISLSGTSTVVVNGNPTALTFTLPTTNPSIPTITAPPLLTINNALITAVPGSKPTYAISGQALTAGGTITITSPNGPETLVLSPDLESLTAIVAGTTAVSDLDQYYIHTPSILPPVLSFSSFLTAAAFSNFPLASSTFIALPGTATAYLLPALTGNGKQTLLPGATATEAAQGTTFLVIMGSQAGELTVEALDSTGGIVAVTTSRLFPASATAATTTSSQSGSAPIGSGSASHDSGIASVTSGGAGKVVKGSASSPRAEQLGVLIAGAAAVIFGLAVAL